MRRVLGIVVLTLALAPASAGAVVSRQVVGTVGDNTWYVTPVELKWTVDPGATVQAGACVAGTTTSIPLTTDMPKTQFRCDATLGGDEDDLKVTIGIDRAAPSGVGAVPARPPDASGWYHAAVQLGWGGQDATSGIASCTGVSYAGPDGDGAPTGTCRDKAGNVSAPSSFALKYDATPPQIRSMKPDRAPDRRGWYVKPLSYSLTAVDATSGVDGCPPSVFQGPDDANANATGTCADRAGNVASASAALRYDATAPAFGQLAASRKTGSITLKWKASGDTDSVTVQRKPDGTQSRTFNGASGSFTDSGLADGVKYTYLVTATDAAGNQTTRKVASSRPSNLLAPAVGAKLKRPPLLRWRAVKKADYYNVQVFEGKRKVLSRWPPRTHLRLPRSWSFAGAHHGLRKGRTYRWYVWPGYGRPSDQKYGRLLGQGQFKMLR